MIGFTTHIKIKLDIESAQSATPPIVNAGIPPIMLILFSPFYLFVILILIILSYADF